MFWSSKLFELTLNTKNIGYIEKHLGVEKVFILKKYHYGDIIYIKRKITRSHA